jgi:hypothetical protein
MANVRYPPPTCRLFPTHCGHCDRQPHSRCGTFFEFIGLAAAFGALTWFKVRTGVDQQVGRDKFPRMFNMLVGINILIIAMCLIAAIGSLFIHPS